MTTPTITQLEEQRAALVARLITTGGHGRRARLQLHIDAIDRQIADLQAASDDWVIVDQHGHDIGEGPWSSREDALAFLHAEVGEPGCAVLLASDLDDDDDTPYCPACGGTPGLLGHLGQRVHLRCRDCGWTYTDQEALS